MANAMPLRWIEHSEAREVLRTARFEQRLVRPRRRLAVEKAAEILIRLRDQLVAMAAAAMPAPQLVPVRVRPVNANASRLYRDGARELFDSYR